MLLLDPLAPSFGPMLLITFSYAKISIPCQFHTGGFCMTEIEI